MKKFKDIINEATKMFTVYKFDTKTDKLSNKEHLNQNELDSWMNKAKFPTILVIEDNSKKYVVYDNVNGKWKAIRRGKRFSMDRFMHTSKF